MTRIETDTDRQKFADIRVNGTTVASVDVLDGEVRIKVIDPDHPGHTMEEFRFDETGDE